MESMSYGQKCVTLNKQSVFIILYIVRILFICVFACDTVKQLAGLTKAI